MNENHQDKTESEQTATEDELSPPPLSSKDQRKPDRPQNNQMGAIIKRLGFFGYDKETQEYTPNGQLAKITTEHQPGKTFWDWLQLLIIPIILAGATIGFSWWQAQLADKQHQNDLNIAATRYANDQQLAADQQQEMTLVNYLEKMSDLITDKHLKDPKLGRDAREIARARTLVTLRSLNVVQPQPPRSPIPLVRKGIILQFLYEAGLINNDNVIVNLEGADLSFTYLPKANLNLSAIDLSNANLIGAFLSTAVLKGANLVGATLAFADLTGANLTGANLTGANLQQAELVDANLTGAKVTPQQLVVTIHIGMTCPNGSKSRPPHPNELPCS